MQTMYYFFALVGLGILLAGIVVWRARRVERLFWTIVQRNPDAAWCRLITDISCIVDDDPGQAIRAQYAGPYRFVTTDGAEHTVYIYSPSIKGTYVEIAHHLLGDDASEEGRHIARELYHNDPRGAAAVKLRRTMLEP